MKLDEVVKHFLMTIETRRYSERTLTSYRYALFLLLRLLDSLCNVTELERVTVLHLRQCVQYLLTTPVEKKKGCRLPDNGSTLSPVTVSVHIRAWKSFFSWCLKEELIEKDPAVRVEFPKVPKRKKPAFSDTDIERMLDVFDLTTDEGFRDYLILLLLLDTGIRRAEVAGLRVVDVHETYIRVVGKGDKERHIGIHPDLSTMLWKYIHKYRHPRTPDEPILFVATSHNRLGLPFGRGGMNGLMGRLKKVAGIEGVRLSPHTFRHTFAKMYLKNGGDLFSLSREMGHSDIKTTQGYLLDFSSDDAVQQHSNFSPLNHIKIKRTRKVNEKKGKSKN